MLALRACGFIAGVRLGHAEILAAMGAMELDPVGLFGDDTVDMALGARVRPACEMVRDVESFTT